MNEILLDFEALDIKIRERNWEDAAHTAHQLVPWVGMAGVTSLENELRTFELVAKRNLNTDEIRLAWDQFKMGLDEALRLLQQELTKLESTR